MVVDLHHDISVCYGNMGTCVQYAPKTQPPEISPRLAQLKWSSKVLKDETIRAIAMKFGSDIHDPRRMNPTDFGDPSGFFSGATMRFDICGFE